MNCPQCQQPMKNLGNTSGMVYLLLTYPEQWDVTWLCDNCKLKKSLKSVQAPMPPNYGYLDTYKSLNNF